MAQRLIDATTLRAEFTEGLHELWHYTGIWAMIDVAPTIEPKQEWISVKDRLPEKDTLVLCVGAKGGMFLGYIRYLYGDDKTAYVRVPNARSGRYAAFWMPLPEPPEKNNEEEQA